MKRILGLCLVFVILLAGCSPAANQNPASANGIEVSQVRVFLPGGDAMAGMDSSMAAFMTIKNTGQAADRLVKVGADFGDASMHESKMDSNNVMTMDEVQGIDIPAGQTVELKNGGYHIMFMKMSKTLKVGDPATLTLEFEKAGKVTVTAKVTDK